MLIAFLGDLVRLSQGVLQLDLPGRHDLGVAVADRARICPRSVAAARWLDLPLRCLKYILLALFLYVVIAMPVPEIRAFLGSALTAWSPT